MKEFEVEITETLQRTVVIRRQGHAQKFRSPCRKKCGIAKNL